MPELTPTPLTAEPLEILRTRTSEKWTAHPDDVIPMFVAEMDYRLAPPVAEALLRHITLSDTGYVDGAEPAASAFADFASLRWGWSVDPSLVTTTTDVSVAIVETLRATLTPGDGVVITPPVYPPFFELVGEAGGAVIEVPLLRAETDDDPDASGPTWSLDLDGLERAFAAGARALLLCNPHNPLGLVHSREVLERVAELAAQYDVTVVSDEIHAPLTHPGVAFTPFLSVSDAARQVGIATPSASKAFNLAGVKCALIVAGSERGRAILDRMPVEVLWRTSILGRAATAAGFGQSGQWLDELLATLAANRQLLRRTLAEELPGAVLHEPQASYLAWIDFSALGFGDDPAEVILREARVALSRGLDFGTQGAGFARLNFACEPKVLVEALRRIAAITPR